MQVLGVANTSNYNRIGFLHLVNVVGKSTTYNNFVPAGSEWNLRAYVAADTYIAQRVVQFCTIFSKKIPPWDETSCNLDYWHHVPILS